MPVSDAVAAPSAVLGTATLAPRAAIPPLAKLLSVVLHPEARMAVTGNH